MILNTGYEVFLSALVSTFVAQVLKVIFYLVKYRKWNFKILSSTGGMPSSHSSCVVALTTSIGIVSGFNSVEFAMSFAYASIVMYDAAGVRRSAGKMATILNRMTEEKGHAQERLKELLGHTPMEVLMGALLGFVFAWFYHGYLIG